MANCKLYRTCDYRFNSNDTSPQQLSEVHVTTTFTILHFNSHAWLLLRDHVCLQSPIRHFCKYRQLTLTLTTPILNLKQSAIILICKRK